jgi:hypothetical protein
MSTVKTQKKRGGSIASDAAKLAIPLGLLLAKKSLQDFLKKNNADSEKKQSSPRQVSRRVIAGGESASPATAAVVEPNDGMQSQYAAVPQVGAKKAKKPAAKKAAKKPKA